MRAGISRHLQSALHRCRRIISLGNTKPPIPKEEVLAESDHYRPLLHKVWTKTEREIAVRLTTVGLQFQFVSGRIKRRESVARKLVRPDKPNQRLWGIRAPG